MLILEEGDLFDNLHQAYGHGVSSRGRMGSGIAIEFRHRYPEMFKEYKNLCHRRELLPGGCFFYESGDERPDVFNLVTQDDLQHASKAYLKSSIQRMHEIALVRNIPDIAIPEIACGLGRLTMDDLIENLRPFIKDPKFNITIYSL